MGIKPIKALSQHFLVDDAVSDAIVASMDIRPGDRILEIGPGEGVLTDRIMASEAASLTAVELDHRLALFLRVKWEGNPKFHLIEQDFLKVDLKGLTEPAGLRVVGNLPYAITSPILFRLLDFRDRISDLTVMVQKEVAERLASPPGSKAYGIPSVLFQLVSEVEPVCGVPPEAFKPPPKVDSAVIRIRFLDQPTAPVQDYEAFRKLVRLGFGQRRKMLRNTLKPLLETIPERPLPVDLSRRAESLSVAEWAQLSNAMQP